METRPTRLHLQQAQATSCWIFVLEAIAKAHGLPTTALKIAMNAYPESEDVAERAYRGSGLEDEDSNLVALRLMAENLTAMVQGLQSLRNDRYYPHDWVSEDSLGTLAKRCLKSTDCIKHITFNSRGYAHIDDLIAIFDNAQQKASLLLNMSTESRTTGSDGILNGRTIKVEPGDHAGARDALKALQSKMPVFLTVYARYPLRQEDLHSNGAARTRVDWTGRRDSMESTPRHALLLTGYDKDRRIVSYKDPNYGNMEIRITTAQFTRMAGDTEYNESLHMSAYSHSRGRLWELAG